MKAIDAAKPKIDEINSTPLALAMLIGDENDVAIKRCAAFRAR